MPDGAAYAREAMATARMRAGAAFATRTPSAAHLHGRLPYAEIVGHIRANLARRISVGELAGIACLSVFQLSRAFRRDHETTPYRLVLDLRIDHAAQMLCAGATIAETALRAGFADQSHFTRHFKRCTGMTPKQFATNGFPRLA